MTSTITCGSRPALTPMTMASDAIARRNAVLPERDRAHDVGRGQAHDHGLDRCGKLARGGSRNRTAGNERGRRSSTGVEDRDLVAGIDEPGGHRRSHPADTNEA